MFAVLPLTSLSPSTITLSNVGLSLTLTHAFVVSVTSTSLKSIAVFPSLFLYTTETTTGL